MDNQTVEETNSDVEGSLAVDHALLESLFYNEMMMLNPSSPGPSNFMSHHFTEVAHAKPHHSEALADPNTLAEKEMLRDFGVASSPIGLSSYSLHTSPEVAASTSTIPQTWDPPHHPQHPRIAPVGQTLAEGTKQAPVFPIQAPLYRSYPPPFSVKPTSSHTPRNPLSVETSLPPSQNHSQDRAKQLVDQFATLASRLGIELPNNVLQSLTAAAALNDPELAGSATRSASVSSNSLDLKQATDISVPPLDEDSSDSAPSTLQGLRKTAEEAITTVTKKRPSDSEDNSYSINGLSKQGKRKKKPRLAESESRLAELRAENELLKRHLENVSNKAHRFDQEKEAAGKRIHALLEHNAGRDEMNAAVREFTEMYSDYGKNRQNELNFHLEQLQRYAIRLGYSCALARTAAFLISFLLACLHRLVNPTNFTKMGLWTLGQNSISPKQNPIAGILQKELDITPQQGRKILDQSEKIKALCENIKECLVLLAKLRSLCQQKTQIFQDRMDMCREILTTKQVVQLIKWIDDHTELLETVCPGWGTEHIHPSVSKHL
jgi:hypothetical protein